MEHNQIIEQPANCLSSRPTLLLLTVCLAAQGIIGIYETEG
jgi:hypothetical protein